MEERQILAAEIEQSRSWGQTGEKLVGMMGDARFPFQRSTRHGDGAPFAVVVH